MCMKKRTPHGNRICSLVLVGGLIAGLLTGCAIGPTPEELAAREAAARQQAQEEARIEAERLARLAKAAEIEQAGLAAEAGGKRREAFKQYLASLEMLDRNPPRDVDARIRERIIKVAHRLDPQPVVPEEAERFAARGAYWLRNAASQADFDQAEAEYDKVLRLAPWWGDAYFNLGVIREKAGEAAGAKRAYEYYLLTNPNGEDARMVKTKIAGLEVEAEIQAPWKRFEKSTDWRLRVRGRTLSLVIFHPSDDDIKVGWKPGDIRASAKIDALTAEGESYERTNDPRFIKCFGAQYELPFQARISADRKTLTLRRRVRTFTIATCAIIKAEWEDWVTVTPAPVPAAG